MHYYKFNIPDWSLATAHLTLEEEAVYFRLVNHYYDTEKPIPDDYVLIARRLRMVGKNDLIDSILQEFFTYTENGWEHQRCSKELDSYRSTREQQSKAGKASAVKRKSNDRSTDDQRPFNDRSTTVQPTNNHKPLTINQEPLTTNQEPETTVKKKTSAFAPCDMPEISQELAEEYIRHRKAVKAPLSRMAWSLFVGEAKKAGWTVEEAVGEAISRGWRSFKADWVQQKGYVPSVFGDVIEGECYAPE